MGLPLAHATIQRGLGLHHAADGPGVVPVATMVRLLLHPDLLAALGPLGCSKGAGVLRGLGLLGFLYGGLEGRGVGTNRRHHGGLDGFLVVVVLVLIGILKHGLIFGDYRQRFPGITT